MTKAKCGGGVSVELLASRVVALEMWRAETTELADLRRRVDEQCSTIMSLNRQLMDEQKRRIEAELRH